MSCDFAYDDGAYILGALAPAERSAYEKHLSTCATCRESVAQLAVLPGLLGRLDPETAAPTLTAPVMLLPKVLTAAATRRRSEQRRRTWNQVAAGMAVAVIAVAVGFGVHFVDRPSALEAQPTPSVTASPTPTGPPMVAMNVSEAPIEAEFAFVPDPSGLGTWVTMHCYYADHSDSSWPVRLVVFPRSGEEAIEIANWWATAGKDIRFSAITYLKPDQIARVELQGAERHNTLTWWNAPN
jgi:putative zinc finger protein